MYENKTSVKKDGISVKEGRDIWWEDSVAKQSTDCPVEWVDAEDPLFLLYTSGSTGRTSQRVISRVLLSCDYHKEEPIQSSKLYSSSVAIRH